MKFKTKLSVLAVQAVVTSMAMPAHAELYLEEIIVSAQKRQESVQDVPISITAMSGEQIGLTGAGNLQGLSDSITNVDIAKSPGDVRVTIRGLGTGVGNTGFEQSVGTYVDGIYVSRSALFQSPFLDLERIEVLKGPQGVLFGKNSIAGALSIISAKPTEEFEAEVSSSYETEYGSHELTGIISGKVAENLYGRLAVKTSDEGGFLDNALNGKDMPESDTDVVRGSLIWDASEDTEVFLKVESSKLEIDGAPWQLVADKRAGSAYDLHLNGPGLPGLEGILANRIFAQNAAGGENFEYDDNSYSSINTTDQDAKNATFQITHKLGEHELVYLASYAEYDRLQDDDVDFAPVDFVRDTIDESFDQVSHELRIVSPGGKTIDYVAGLYYLKSNLDSTSQFDFFGGNLDTSDFGGLDSSYNTDFTQESTTLSVFTQATWNITDTLRTSIGLRYSEEEKNGDLKRNFDEYNTTNSPLDPVTAGTVKFILGREDLAHNQTTTEYNLDPSFNIQWEYSESGMAYFSWTKATKSGGFNAQEDQDDFDSFTFDPESATGIEIGFKTELLDGRGRLNVSLFTTEFDDLQVGTFNNDTGSFSVGNAAAATSEGIEVEGVFAFSETLTLGGSAAYLKAEYDEYFASCPANALENVNRDCDADGSGNNLQDLSGKQLQNAPEKTASLYADYSRPISNNLVFGARLDANYKDDTVLDAIHDSNMMAESVWTYNFRLSLDSADEVWGVSLTAFNLTDEQYITLSSASANNEGFYVQNRNRGRQFELAATYRFGK